jgi:2-desacetyl-2-hydroxyethyl bacteriochlorophyllide A dehydrogenase
MKYRQAFLKEPHQFEMKEVDNNPKEDDVVVKIAACGLCNWELNFWHGNLNFYGYPHPLGHEWAGVVESAGSDVKGFKKGDKVSGFARGFGGFAEYKFAKESQLQKLDDRIDPKYAMGEPQKCIITVLRASRVESSDIGLILGCGPMGLWCIQGLSGNFLEKLIAVDIDDKKLEMAKNFGATHIINSQKINVIDELIRITGGRLADFVIEGTGIPALLNEAQHYVKKGRGKIVLMSSHSQPAKEFDFRVAIEKSLEIIVAHPDYSFNELEDFRRAVAFINNGTFKNKELVTHEFALADIQSAFETLGKKSSDYIKGIVVCN